MDTQTTVTTNDKKTTLVKKATGKKANAPVIATVTEVTPPPTVKKDIVVKENVTGKKLTLQNSKIETNKAHKQELATLTFCLHQIKKHGAKYVKDINEKFNVKVTLSQIESLTNVELCKYMTDKDKARQAVNGNKWSVWLVSGLIAKMYNPKFN